MVITIDSVKRITAMITNGDAANLLSSLSMWFEENGRSAGAY